jgi:hypothetical protein
MSIVPYSGAAAATATAAIVAQVAPAVSRAISDALSSGQWNQRSGAPANSRRVNSKGAAKQPKNTSPKATVPGSSKQQLVTMPKRSKNQPKQRRSVVPRGVAYAPNVTLVGSYGLTNASAGNSAYAFTMGINTNLSGSVSLGTLYGSNLTSWQTLYRMFKITKLKVSFVTGAPNTVSGNLSMGIDADPLAAAPTGYQNCIRHLPHALTPIYQNTSMVWYPRSHKDNEDRFTALASPAHDESEVSFGVIQVLSTNSAAASVGLGILLLETTFAFSEQC